MSLGSKPMASLSSSLLARKGQARPAMRPQGYVSLTPSHDDLGWNDMGEEFAPHPAPTPHIAAVPPAEPVAPVAEPAPAPEVLRQRAALDEQFPPVAEAAPLVAPEPKPQPAPKPAAVKASVARVAREAKAHTGKAAFTLRLDNDRHLRLRLASAVTNRSAQQLVTEALDAFLESLTDVDALATQLSAGHGRTAS